MKPKDYILVRIEGEYAYLREVGVSDAGNDLFIALALLPTGSDEGTKLHYECFCYTMIE